MYVSQNVEFSWNTVEGAGSAGIESYNDSIKSGTFTVLYVLAIINEMARDISAKVTTPVGSAKVHKTSGAC